MRRAAVSPGPRRQRDGLVVSALDGVAAVAGVGGWVEDWPLYSDVNLLPLVWQLHRQEVKLLKPSGDQNVLLQTGEKHQAISSLEFGKNK